MENKTVPANDGDEAPRVFQSVEDYLLHYSARSDKDGQQTEWYELGVEATRLAIKHVANSPSLSAQAQRQAPGDK